MIPDKPEEYIELWWGDPSQWRWSNCNVLLRVGMAVSETEVLQHADIALHNLKQCDLLICPSKFSARAYEESPLDIPIAIVPLGVDTDEYKYTDRSWYGSMRYLLAGAAQFRKGTWLGIEGFIKAFHKFDAVKLIVWSSVKTPEREALKKEYGKNRKIIFDDRILTSANDIYKDCHVIVSPHLSEGFGLMPFEAMATGMPCLMARCSSPMEYFHDDYGWWIEMSNNFAPVGECMKDTVGFWRLPDVDSIANMMKYSYWHRNESKAKGIAASRYVNDKLSWDIVAKRLYAVIQSYVNAKMIKYPNHYT